MSIMFTKEKKNVGRKFRGHINNGYFLSQLSHYILDCFSKVLTKCHEFSGQYGGQAIFKVIRKALSRRLPS